MSKLFFSTVVITSTMRWGQILKKLWYQIPFYHSKMESWNCPPFKLVYLISIKHPLLPFRINQYHLIKEAIIGLNSKSTSRVSTKRLASCYLFVYYFCTIVLRKSCMYPLLATILNWLWSSNTRHSFSPNYKLNWLRLWSVLMIFQHFECI